MSKCDVSFYIRRIHTPFFGGGGGGGGGKLSPKLSKQPQSAVVKKYKKYIPYSSLVNKYNIFSLQTISLLSALDMH